MPKTDCRPNELFWAARIRLDLTRPAVADLANHQPIMTRCEHAPLNENYIGRVEQGRIGGGMCTERRSALCLRLEVDDPAFIGLVIERRRPTRSAATRSRGPSRHGGSPRVAAVEGHLSDGVWIVVRLEGGMPGADPALLVTSTPVAGLSRSADAGPVRRELSA